MTEGAGRSMARDPVRRRPGGRTARTRTKVLGAALDLLLAEGYDELSVARVAAAAGVAESTVYRRWATRERLAAEAVAELALAENPIPDTGALESDLRELLVQVIRLVERPEVARVVRAVVAATAGDGEAVPLRDEFWRTRFAGSAAIVGRAVERGELPEDADAYEVIEELVAAAYFRLLVTGRPLDQRLVEESVRRVVRTWGVAPG